MKEEEVYGVRQRMEERVRCKASERMMAPLESSSVCIPFRKKVARNLV